MMTKNKPLTFGIIGTGVAVAIGVRVLFGMPLLTGGAQPQQQPALTDVVN